MSTYTEFNKANLKMIRRQFEVLLGAFADEHGLEINLRSISFQKQSFKVPMEVRIKGAVTEEEKINKELLEFEMKENNLKLVGRDGYTLVDYLSNRPKYPFIFTQKNGGSKYKCSLEQARRIFGEPRVPTITTRNLLEQVAPPNTH